MPAVKAVATAHALRVGNVRSSIVQICEGLHSSHATKIPRPAVIVFAASSNDCWFRLVIDEDHFIAFAHPSVLVLQLCVSDANKMSFAARFEKNVIPLSRWV